MTQRVFIVHGFEGDPHGNWFDWLAENIQAAGAQSFQLSMPNPNHPDAHQWQHLLDEAVGTLDEQTFLVGHSLGTISLLHFLSRRRPSRLGGLVLVAGFADRLPRLPVLDGYIDESQPDYVALEKIGMPVRCLISDNDDHVPTESSVRMAHALNSPIDWVADGGHLMASDGFTTLPAVWAALQPMLLGAKAA